MAGKKKAADRATMEVAVPLHVFKPRARLLYLLGDQLIRDAGIAVFELVKNAYDADASYARVTLDRVSEGSHGSITVLDDGVGMDLQTIIDVWLEPGTDYRREQRQREQRTRKGRLPLGEKGVGRFAAHKIGDAITLVTRRSRHPEVVVEFSWRNIGKYRYITEVPVSVITRKPEVFKGRTGTQIEIRDLHEKWTREMVRDLARAITSITSPFLDREGDFAPQLQMQSESERDWLDGLLTPRSVRRYALFRATGKMEGSRLSYRYEFKPFPAMADRVAPRQVTRPDIELVNTVGRQTHKIDLKKYKIGTVSFEFSIFDLDPQTLALGVADRKGLREFLNTSGGVRVYRDGVRVYDYGEPGNDWLDLGGRRVNVPSLRISNNLIIGAISLDGASSDALIEKTNREGFVDNAAYRVFRDAVRATLVHVENERNVDKTRMRKALANPRLGEPVLSEVAELREISSKRGWREITPYLDRIEKDYVAVRDQLLTSASAGLSLTVVIHEVEKGLKELVRAADKEAGARVAELARNLAQLVEGLASLVRRSGATRERASSLIDSALLASRLRLAAHGVDVERRVSTDFTVKASKRLVVATLANLIDNAIYWLDVKYGSGRTSKPKRLLLGSTRDLAGGPGIVVADNGPGFLDPPEYLVQPFITRKTDGMGLGLHLADQVMRTQGGRLLFPDRGDIAVGREFSGAVVVLQFLETK
jgi:signal transduction histidine kinase